MSKVIYTFFLLLCFSTLIAQAPKELYLQAEEALQKGDFKTAIIRAEKAKALFPNTNPKIETFLLSAYFFNQEFVKAKIAYETLRKITPASKQNTADFLAIMAMGKSIDASLEAEEKEFEKQQQLELQKRMTEAYKIENNNSKSLTAKKETQQNHSAESKIYKKAKQSGNLEDLKTFTDAFPNSSHFNEINNQVKSIEKEKFRVSNEENAWNTALQRNSIFAFENYLSTYYDGKYIDEAKENIYQLKAHKQYSFAKATQNLDEYTTYYNTYKRGNDFEKVKNTLASYYLKSGDEAFEENDWSLANQHYNNYVIVNGSGTPSYLSHKRTKVKKMLKQHSFDYFSMHYDKYSHGAMFGSLLKDGTGFYMSIRGRTNFLFGAYETNDVEFEDGVNTFEEENGGYGDMLWKTRHTKDITNFKKQSFVGLLGISQKIAYPLWLTAGIGFGTYRRQHYVITEQYRRNESSIEYTWRPDTEGYTRDMSYKKYGTVWEAGVRLVLFKGLFLSYGLTNGHGEVVHYFGIGAGGKQ